MSETGFSGK